MDLLEWTKALAPFVLLLISALLAVAGYLGKKMINGVIEEQKSMKTAQSNLEKDFLRMRGELPFTFITRDDHIRHITILEHKIDESRREMNAAMSGIQNDIKRLIREIPKRSNDG